MSLEECEAHLVRASLDPFGSVLLRDSSTNLHAAFPCLQCFLGCLVVSGPKHYDVCACQVMLFVEVCVESGGVFGGPVRLQDVGSCGVQRAADDLLDASGVQVYARAKACHFAMDIIIVGGVAGEGRVKSGGPSIWR
jgi:hypothetical protein